MKLDFIVNKYLLIWHLLYQSSVSEDIHKLKQKLWKDNKKEYTLIHKDKSFILEDVCNFIPDNDLIYNKVESSLFFKKVKIETSRYRLALLEAWDKNRKKYMLEMNKILKYDFKGDYNICVIHPSLDVIETDLETNTVTIGKKIASRDKDNFLTYLIYKILKQEFLNIKTDEREIVDAITELITINELFTRVTKESKYNMGKKSLREIKEKIYPYWLMYLGYEKSDMEKLFVRDNIFFDINNLEYNKIFKELDIYGFINYIIKNKKEILNKKTVVIEEIELL